MNDSAQPTSKLPKQTSLQPITDRDIPAVAEFLHQHMNSRFSTEDWANGLNACWLDDAPNHGFTLKADDQIVGALCAIYSLQTVKGKKERFCNPHTWCVLEPYRSKSVPLVLSIIRQEGYQFTMFTPNKEGEQIFSYLGFKPLDRSKIILPNTPSLRRFKSSEIFCQNFPDHLPEDLARCAQDHQPYPWINSFAFHSGNQYCLIFYKSAKFKKSSCANITYISNKDLFARCWGEIKNYLLFKRGIFFTRIDKRFLRKPPRLSFNTLEGPARFYLSDKFDESAIEYIYSELTVMNL